MPGSAPNTQHSETESQKRMYLARLEGSCADGELSPVLLARLFQSATLQEIKQVILPSALPGPILADVNFQPEDDALFAAELDKIKRLALECFYKRHVAELDFSALKTVNNLKKLLKFCEGKDLRTVAEKIHSQSGAIKGRIVGADVDATKLPEATLGRLIKHYQQAIEKHDAFIGEHGDFDADDAFASRIQLPASITDVFLRSGESVFLESAPAGLSSGPLAPTTVLEAVQFYHFLANEMVATLARSPLDAANHENIYERARNAEAVLGYIIRELDAKISSLDETDPVQSREKARLLVAVEAVKLKQKFMTSFGRYHGDKYNAMLASSQASSDQTIKKAHYRAQVTYAEAVWRSNAVWQEILGHVRGMSADGSIDVTLRNANVVPGTAEQFEEIFDQQRRELLRAQDGVDVSAPKKSNKDGVTITSIDITMQQEEKVTVEHHAYPASTGKQPELKATSSSARSLARVLALMYKVDLQKEGKLDLAGNSVDNFSFTLSDDQIDLSHNSDKPGATPSVVTADEREQFLSELDKAFKDMFGDTYTGRVATEELPQALRMPTMQGWRSRRTSMFSESSAPVQPVASVPVAPPRA